MVNWLKVIENFWWGEMTLKGADLIGIIVLSWLIPLTIFGAFKVLVMLIYHDRGLERQSDEIKKILEASDEETKNLLRKHGFHVDDKSDEKN
jgi:hypothetical protein